jgi:hypothetical protein
MWAHVGLRCNFRSSASAQTPCKGGATWEWPSALS